ncbi:hypothetical protein HA466_0195850 [Hirschfeldia incana]|nr:hypothetical protein HA466_0195850 [Hirschfeldia incana]
MCLGRVISWWSILGINLEFVSPRRSLNHGGEELKMTTERRDGRSLVRLPRGEEESTKEVRLRARQRRREALALQLVEAKSKPRSDLVERGIKAAVYAISIG